MGVEFIDIVLFLGLAYLYYNHFTTGKIKGNTVKNEKGETIYKEEN